MSLISMLEFGADQERFRTVEGLNIASSMKITLAPLAKASVS